MSLNEELMRDPLEFAKTYCILGNDHALIAPKDQREVAGYIYSKMTGMTKISYLDCRKVDLAAELNSQNAVPEGKVMKNEGAETIFIAPCPPAAGLVPAWFLPWDERGGMVQLSIPSAAKFRLGHWKANRVSEYYRDWKKVEEYPKFFLTAAINGCSVFVSGNEREPTVFHGGKGAGVDGDAIQVWRDMHQNIDKPKPPKENIFFRAEPKKRLPVAEVNKSMYVKDGVSKDKGGNNTTATANRFEDALNRAVKGGPIKIREIRPWGAVFGICDEFGSWKFYLQENATIRYDVVEKIALGPLTKKPKPFSVSRPMVVRQIFPDHGGSAIMQNQFSIMELPRRN